MENINDILDDLTNLDFDKDQHEQLESKYKNRTQVDVNEPFYIGSGWARDFLQFLSVVLGFGICLHMADKFPSIEVPIFILFLTGLILVEIGKRKCSGKINEIRIINKIKKSKKKLSAMPYRIGLVFFVSLSLISGFIGSSEVIEYYSEHKPLVVLDSIRANFNKQISEVKEEFTLSSSNAFAMANKLHNESNWKGNTSKEVRKEKATLIVLGAKTDSLKTVAVQDLTLDMNTSLSSAKSNNKEIVTKHKEWCASFAWWAIGFVVIFDFLVIVLSRWMSDHEDRKIKENRAKEKLIEESKEVGKTPVKGVKKDKDLTFIDREIVKGSGRKAHTITVSLDDGILKTYTFGKFRNYFKNSSEKRQDELQHYLDSVEEFEADELKKKLEAHKK